MRYIYAIYMLYLCDIYAIYMRYICDISMRYICHNIYKAYFVNIKNSIFIVVIQLLHKDMKS